MMRVAQQTFSHRSPFSNDESIIDTVVIRRYLGRFMLNTGSRKVWFSFNAPIATFKGQNNKDPNMLSEEEKIFLSSRHQQLQILETAQ